MRHLTKASLKFISAVLLLTVVLFSGSIRDNYYRESVGDGVVRIFNMEKTGAGTGFHVKLKSGELAILTNKHVCDMGSPKNETVIIEKDGEEIPRQVLERYKHHDLCLVEALSQDESYIDIADSSQEGEDLVIIGHPGARDLTLAHGELIGKKVIDLQGPVKSESDCQGKTFEFFFQLICVESFHSHAISAIAYGGNSGSPVVNKYGNVIGVLFAGSNQPTDSYMVPLKYVKDFLNQ